MTGDTSPRTVTHGQGENASLRAGEGDRRVLGHGRWVLSQWTPAAGSRDSPALLGWHVAGPRPAPAMSVHLPHRTPESATPAGSPRSGGFTGCDASPRPPPQLHPACPLSPSAPSSGISPTGGLSPGWKRGGGTLQASALCSLSQVASPEWPSHPCDPAHASRGHRGPAPAGEALRKPRVLCLFPQVAVASCCGRAGALCWLCGGFAAFPSPEVHRGL